MGSASGQLDGPTAGPLVGWSLASAQVSPPAAAKPGRPPADTDAAGRRAAAAAAEEVAAGEVASEEVASEVASTSEAEPAPDRGGASGAWARVAPDSAAPSAGIARGDSATGRCR